VLPKALDFLDADGEIAALVKPQFEAGRDQVGKGGIIRDESVRLSALNRIAAFAETSGFRVVSTTQSPLPGQKGNIEYFIHLKRG
jgi:23S rRNA (cytidine1920-2'-O)/16S rRNA (cytidine1409-2'-O)-methyltransferase